MRRLIWGLVWLGLLYSGYWFAVSQILQTGADRAGALLADQGADLTIGSVTTTGYPVRFDTVLHDLHLAGTDWAWHAPQITLQADSYRPLSLGMRFAQDQVLRLADQTLLLGGENWHAHIALRPTPLLAFDAGWLRMGAKTVVSDAGWQFDLGQLAAGLTDAGGLDPSYDAELTAERLVLPAPLRDQIDPAATLGPEIEAITGAARLVFAQPLDRDLQGALPDLDQITLHDLRFDWGSVTLQASGDVAIDSVGIPTGRIDLRSQQWGLLLDFLIAAGLIEPSVRNAITRVAGFMADADGVLTVPLVFQEGMMLVGPVPVGPAPRLR